MGFFRSHLMIHDIMALMAKGMCACVLVFEHFSLLIPNAVNIDMKKKISPTFLKKFQV